jgi:hypothetical protein
MDKSKPRRSGVCRAVDARGATVATLLLGGRRGAKVLPARPREPRGTSIAADHSVLG